jgi:hypothetical protein
MKFALLCTGGVAVLVLSFLWTMTRIQYRVGRRHVKVLLFGIPIRRIAITRIAYASKHEPDGFAERWYNTFRTAHRLVTIEKNKGFPRNVCITPKNRYAFLGEIKEAVRRADPKAEWAQVTTFEESTAILSQANAPEARGKGKEL